MKPASHGSMYWLFEDILFQKQWPSWMTVRTEPSINFRWKQLYNFRADLNKKNLQHASLMMVQMRCKLIATLAKWVKITNKKHYADHDNLKYWYILLMHFIFSFVNSLCVNPLARSLGEAKFDLDNWKLWKNLFEKMDFVF